MPSALERTAKDFESMENWRVASCWNTIRGEWKGVSKKVQNNNCTCLVLRRKRGLAFGSIQGSWSWHVTTEMDSGHYSTKYRPYVNPCFHWNMNILLLVFIRNIQAYCQLPSFALCIRKQECSWPEKTGWRRKATVKHTFFYEATNHRSVKAMCILNIYYVGQN